MSQVKAAATRWTVLDTAALLVANAKQITDNHMKVTLLHKQISEGNKNLEHCCERPVLCRNKNVVISQID